MQTTISSNQVKENGLSHAVAANNKSNTGGIAQFQDNRSEVSVQRKLQTLADSYSSGQEVPIQKKENNTGLPDNLKSGIENLSGYSMDDVKVHYNSEKPAQLNAHAYAQGTDIHLGSGQEKHLPHEAWHVVQQKQGRVQATMQMKDFVNINDDEHLEREADVMGTKALQLTSNEHIAAIITSPVSVSGVVSRKSTSESVPLNLQPFDTSSTVFQLRNGLPAPNGGGAPAQGPVGLFGDIADLPGGLRPIVQQMLQATVDGDLVITQEQGATLVRLLRDIVAEIFNPPDSVAAPLFPLSFVVNRVLGINVTRYFGGNDLYLPADFFIRNPLWGAADGGQAVLPAIAPAGIDEQELPDIHAFLQRLAMMGVNLGDLGVINIGALFQPQQPVVGALSLMPPPQNANPNVLGPQVQFPHWLWRIVQQTTMAGLQPPQIIPLVHVIAANQPINNPQLDRAVTIFADSGRRVENVQGWIDAGMRGQQPQQAPMVGAAAGPPPPPALDTILGIGGHAAITAPLALANNPYAANPFIANHARALLAAGMGPANVQNLLVGMIPLTNRETVFDRGIHLASQMQQAQVPFAQIQTFIHTQPATALTTRFQGPLINPGAPNNGLIRRNGVTSALLVNILTTLDNLVGGAAAMNAFLTNRMPATFHLSLPRINQRLVNFTGVPPNQALTMPQTNAEFNTLEQSIGARIGNGSMSVAAAGWIRQAFRLIRSASRQEMQTFLADGRVNGGFNNAQATNPAYHLLQFARFHVGALPVGFVPVIVPVLHAAGPRNVQITQWIINHIRERHTFDNFAFNNAGVMARPVSTMFNPPVINADLTAEITRILGDAVVTGGDWAAGNAIDVGAVRLRFFPPALVPGVGQVWRLSQYFYAVAGGTQVPQGTVAAIHARFGEY